MRRSKETNNGHILHNIDPKQILINMSHFEQAVILVVKYPLYHKLALIINDIFVRKYEKVIYQSFKRRKREDV